MLTGKQAMSLIIHNPGGTTLAEALGMPQHRVLPPAGVNPQVMAAKTKTQEANKNAMGQTQSMMLRDNTQCMPSNVTEIQPNTGAKTL
jgi:hypothetical protein